MLGSLIEKQRTTPDQYPCRSTGCDSRNQAMTNREPVVTTTCDDPRGDRQAKCRVAVARLMSGPGSRVAKFRHLLDDALGRVPSQIALLAVLMLRGPQTPGELKQRVERLYPYGLPDDVQNALDAPG